MLPSDPHLARERDSIGYVGSPRNGQSADIGSSRPQQVAASAKSATVVGAVIYLTITLIPLYPRASLGLYAATALLLMQGRPAISRRIALVSFVLFGASIFSFAVGSGGRPSATMALAAAVVFLTGGVSGVYGHGVGNGLLQAAYVHCVVGIALLIAGHHGPLNTSFRPVNDFPFVTHRVPVAGTSSLTHSAWIGLLGASAIFLVHRRRGPWRFLLALPPIYVFMLSGYRLALIVGVLIVLAGSLRRTRDGGNLLAVGSLVVLALPIWWSVTSSTVFALTRPLVKVVPFLERSSRWDFQLQVESLQGRTDVWSGAVDAFLDSSPREAILGSDAPLADRFSLTEGFAAFSDIEDISAHNSALQQLMTTGLVGLAAWSLLLLFALRMISRPRHLPVAQLAALVAGIAFGGTESILSVTTIAPSLLWIALVSAAIASHQAGEHSVSNRSRRGDRTLPRPRARTSSTAPAASAG